MADAIKCRECHKPPTSGYLTIRAVRPSTLCLSCVSKYQHRNGVPSNIGDFVVWYSKENASGASAVKVLREEVDELRKLLKTLGHEV